MISKVPERPEPGEPPSFVLQAPQTRIALLRTAEFVLEISDSFGPAPIHRDSLPSTQGLDQIIHLRARRFGLSLFALRSCNLIGDVGSNSADLLRKGVNLDGFIAFPGHHLRPDPLNRGAIENGSRDWNARCQAGKCQEDDGGFARIGPFFGLVGEICG
jgi:hypothetical protein